MRLQRSANQAVAHGLIAYEHRRGWTGNLRNVVAAKLPMASFEHPDWALMPRSGDYVHAMVTFVQPQQVSLRIGKQRASMAPADWTWTGYTTADKFLKQGDIVYVHLVGDTKPDTLWHAQLEQDSGAEASFFAVDNATGDVIAMVGGRDPLVSQYNRATQSERQTGSSFKPYVYTAAVEAGARPGDSILDAPVSFGGYTPHNYDNSYKGNISLLAAFADSRNIPALKLAERVGIRKVIEVAHRFGITENIQPFLPVALGSADVTLREQVAAYSVFPNDGLLVQPRLIRKISTPDGRIIQEPPMQMKQIISLKTARTMRTFLEEVTRAGTAAAAAQLKHPLGGKTGTTNDFTDAWFIGFSPSVTAGVWVGYDDRQSLGEKETGAKAALPIWMDFMRAAIAEHPGETFADTDVPSLRAPETALAAAPPAQTTATPATKPAVPLAATTSKNPPQTPAAPKPAPAVTGSAGSAPSKPAAKAIAATQPSAAPPAPAAPAAQP
jgi:penicillin-binding protein 1A